MSMSDSRERTAYVVAIQAGDGPVKRFTMFAKDAAGAIRRGRARAEEAAAELVQVCVRGSGETVYRRGE